MATLILTPLDEASGAGLQFTVRDSIGNDVPAGSISAISYTWSDEAGAVINERLDQDVAAANPVTISLSAVDTTLLETETNARVTRLLTVTWTYNDALLGPGTIKTKEFAIQIENHINK